jgi:hypothetical protein
LPSCRILNTNIVLNSRRMSKEFHALDRVRKAMLDRGDHHYIVLCHLHRWIEEMAAQANGVLFDFGCGGRQYEALFRTVCIVTSQPTWWPRSA